MSINFKNDYIISPTKGDFALIHEINEVCGTLYSYKAILIENSLSVRLIELCIEYQECINSFSIILADEIEKEISTYQLCLKYNKIKVFDLKVYDSYVTFFTKYRTADGFLNDYRRWLY